MHKFIENIAQVLVGIGIMYSISSIYEKRQQAQLLIAPYIAPLYDIYPLQNAEPIYHDYSTETEPVTEPLETTESPRVDNFEPPITNRTARVPQVTLFEVELTSNHAQVYHNWCNEVWHFGDFDLSTTTFAAFRHGKVFEF